MDLINIRFKEVRESLKISQKALGDALGLSNSGISNIESGIRSVTDKHIKLLSATFNINEEWLRNGSGSIFNESDDTIISDVAAQYKLGELDKEILKIFLELSPEKRDAFKDFAFALVDSVLNNDTLYMAYRNQYIENNTLPFAARGGDSSNLDEAAELFDKAMEAGEQGDE